MRLRIGEFSLATELSLKTLRLYHEKGILVPAEVDADTGYRFYDERNLERAAAIRALRRFDFSLAEIAALLAECSDESDMRPQLAAKLEEVRREEQRYAEIANLLRSMVDSEEERAMDGRSGFEIEEVDVDTVLVAGHRMTGRYEDVGKGLALVCRKMGRHANGKPMTLYYDDEYKEDGADFEPCVPVRKGSDADGITVRELPGGRCLSLVHKGPYDTLRESYARLFAHAAKHGLTVRRPTREIYRKGPGMILKGNPKNYLTEILLPLEDAEA